MCGGAMKGNGEHLDRLPEDNVNKSKEAKRARAQKEEFNKSIYILKRSILNDWNIHRLRLNGLHARTFVVDV